MADERPKDAKRPGGPGGTRGMLSLDELKKAGDSGEIDTVVTAFTDMQGRLFGKRIQIEYFLDEVTGHGSPPREVTVMTVCRELQKSQKTSPPNKHA